MEAILQALGGILFRAIPSVVLLIFVHFYLKYVFFKPLGEVLAKRRALTQGAQASAEETLARAGEKTAMYELALREARTEIYREQEETRRRLVDEQTGRIDEARHKSHELIKAAEQRIVAEAEAAKRELQTAARSLANEITATLTEERAA